VAADRVRLNEVARLTRLGRFDEATAALERLEAVAEYPPLAAEAAYQRADLLGEQTQYAASKSAYREALNLAASSHHLVVQVQALLDLAFTLVEDVDNFDERARGEIDAMLGLAEGTLRGMVPDLDLQRHLVGNRAWIRQQLGDLPGAIADAREAVRLAEREPGPASGEALAASHVLAGALYAADRFAEADQVATAALAAAAGRWPDRHDSVRLLIELNAAIAMSRNRPAAAAALATRALAAVSRSSARARARPSTRWPAVTPAAARTTPPPRWRCRDSAGPRESTTAAMAHANRALALSLAGRYVEAAGQRGRRWLQFERIFGPAHPNLIDALCNQALTALDVGQPRDGEAPARRAYQIALTHLGPDEPGLANPLATLAIVLAVNRHGPEAGRLAQRAIALAGPGDDRAAVRGEAELALAMAQVQAGDLAQGRATGQAALATLTRAGDGGPTSAGPGWLATAAALTAVITRR
jgi:tetratricopeptide (TPR) repeat protein